MEKKDTLLLPRRSLYYIMVCGGGILAFILMGIIPSQLTLRELDSEISTVRAQIEEQKTLLPVFQELLLKDRKAYEMGLSLPATRARLAQDQIDGISAVLAKLAVQCNLEIVNVATDLKSLESDVRTLRVRTLAKGELSQFRCFLLELNRLPYLESIDEVRVQQVSEGKEIQLVLALALGD